MPSQRVLPLLKVQSYTNQNLRLYHADLELSNQDLTVKPWTFLPTGKDMAVSASLSFGDVALAEIAVDTAETDWQPIEVVDLDELEQFKQAGQFAIALYGTPRRMRFSWDPTLDPRRVRINYDEIQPDPQFEGQVATIPSYYATMVACRNAVDCIADILEKTPANEAALMIRMARVSKRLEEFEARWQTKIYAGNKEGRHLRGAFNRGRSGWGRRGRS